jgi:hypothetical protein
MTIALSGKLVDVGIHLALDALVEQPDLTYLRLNGPSIDIRIIHIGNGQCIVNDYTRKVRDRLGERLVRWGFLARPVLLEQLKRQEDEGVRLDFSEYVPTANLEYVVMNQTLDSLDRLSLFPMLDYQIAPQTTVYRGAKISEAAIRKRCRWIEEHRDCFLVWRKRLDEGRLHMDPIARGLSRGHANVDKALCEGGDWGAFQSALHEPIANIALRLDSLLLEGHLHYAEPDLQTVIKVDRVRYRLASMVFSLVVLGGGVYLAPLDQGRVKAGVIQPWLHLKRFSNVSHTRTMVAFEAERHRERHARYPSAAVMLTRLEQFKTSGVGDRRPLYGFQYIGLEDEFVVLTSSSASDGEQE